MFPRTGAVTPLSRIADRVLVVRTQGPTRAGVPLEDGCGELSLVRNRSGPSTTARWTSTASTPASATNKADLRRLAGALHPANLGHECGIWLGCVGMRTTTGEAVRVGAVTIPFETAQEWVGTYTTRDTTGPQPYAYPAYDRYQRDDNQPHQLTDADLLAPGLLNVPVKIRSFYGLQRIRRELEKALAHPGLDAHLTDTDPTTIGPLYEVLDDPDTKPWGVEGTTLSKILHRKRPHTLVLHDKWVRACYVGTTDEHPVPRVQQRSWADYMTLITSAIAEDLRTQTATFAALDALTPAPGELSHVRLLDILAWTSQGHATSEAADAGTGDCPTQEG
jgi:hypothetical protein